MPPLVGKSVFYVVEHSDPDDIIKYIRHNKEDLRNTTYTLDGMRSDTTYIIRVSAHNCVSDLDKQNARGRTVEINNRTKEGRKIRMIV